VRRNATARWSENRAIGVSVPYLQFLKGQLYIFYRFVLRHRLYSVCSEVVEREIHMRREGRVLLLSRIRLCLC